MLRFICVLCILVGYLEVGSLVLTGNLMSLPCACAAFGVAKVLREFDGGEAETA